MKHEIDLSKYEMRTDLVIETIDDQMMQKKDEDGVVVTYLSLSKEEGKKIGKHEGTYITIEFEDVTDMENANRVQSVFIKQVKKLLKEMQIKDDASFLVMGLGNDKSTPDALGPLTIDQVIVTRHLYELGDVDSRFRNVAAINPGVMGKTGIETVSILKGVVDTIKPDAVIVVDALKSGSISRVNRTIQITNTGIQPGSGVGNKRKEISKEILGIPVIAIGVPTVVDLVTIVSDTVNFMHQHFSYIKSRMDHPSSKLVSTNTINFLKKEVTVLEDDKVKLLGMLGYLSEEELKQLFLEVLTPVGYNLIVTPKEIDFLVKKLSEVIGNGLNQILHRLL